MQLEKLISKNIKEYFLKRNIKEETNTIKDYAH